MGKTAMPVSTGSEGGYVNSQTANSNGSISLKLIDAKSPLILITTSHWHIR